MAAFIHENFIPVGAHIKERAAYFHRFDVLWTPTVLIMDPAGRERMRMEGYMPKEEFRAWLSLALARLAFVRKGWEEAGRLYDAVAADNPQTTAAPEAVYWSGVCRYKKSHDGAALGETAAALRSRYPSSLWAAKASVWLG